MSVDYTCDHCGQPIESNDERASLWVRPSWKGVGRRRTERVYHDNNGGLTCFAEVLALLEQAELDGGRPTSPQDSLTAFNLTAFKKSWAEQREGWTQLSLIERERLVVETLGESTLSISDLIEKWSDRPDLKIHYPEVYPTVKALYDAGELNRSIRPVRGTARVCNHYFRKTELSGPITDLERTFHDEPEAA